MSEQPTTAAGRALPPHTRLILAAEDILSMFGSRTFDGYRISAEWGEQKPEGWYEPTFTVHYDDDLRAEARQQERERIRAAVKEIEIATEGFVEVYLKSDVLAILDADVAVPQKGDGSGEDAPDSEPMRGRGAP